MTSPKKHINRIARLEAQLAEARRARDEAMFALAKSIGQAKAAGVFDMSPQNFQKRLALHRQG